MNQISIIGCPGGKINMATISAKQTIIKAIIGMCNTKSEIHRVRVTRSGLCTPTPCLEYWMARSFHSGSRCPGLRLASVLLLCSCVRHCILIEDFSSREYKWVQRKCLGVTCIRLASHPGEYPIFFVIMIIIIIVSTVIYSFAIIYIIYKKSLITTHEK